MQDCNSYIHLSLGESTAAASIICICTFEASQEDFATSSIVKLFAIGLFHRVERSASFFFSALANRLTFKVCGEPTEVCAFV